MKALALQIIKLAVAGKLLAALQLRPALAGVHQPAGNAAAAVLRQDKDTLQIADRAGGAALHIVAPQRALGKSDRPLPFQGQQNRASVGDGVLEGGMEFLPGVGGPELSGQLCRLRQLLVSG